MSYLVTDIQPANATVAGKRSKGVSPWDCTGSAEKEVGQRLMTSVKPESTLKHLNNGQNKTKVSEQTTY